MTDPGATPPTTYRRPLLKLQFEDAEYEGLIVYCRRPRIDDVLAMDALRGARLNGGDQEALLVAIDDGFSAIAGLIVSWNLVNEYDAPVPISSSGLRSLDLGFVMTLLGEVMTMSLGVARPLPQPSSGGDPSLEVSIPMDSLSESPPSTGAPG